MMAVYCDEECRETGGCCDFCIHYVDDSIEYGRETFSGEGRCAAKNIRTEAWYGCDDDFHCRLAKERDEA